MAPAKIHIVMKRDSNNSRTDKERTTHGDGKAVVLSTLI